MNWTSYMYCKVKFSQIGWFAINREFTSLVQLAGRTEDDEGSRQGWTCSRERHMILTILRETGCTDEAKTLSSHSYSAFELHVDSRLSIHMGVQFAPVDSLQRTYHYHPISPHLAWNDQQTESSVPHPYSLHETDKLSIYSWFLTARWTDLLSSLHFINLTSVKLLMRKELVEVTGRA